MNLKLAATSACILVACSGITDPACSCSPPGGGTAVITGHVIDPASNVVKEAAVILRLLQDESCAELNPPVTKTQVTSESGHFRHVEAWSGGKKCFSVWAEPPEGSPFSSSEQHVVRIDFLDEVVPDSVTLLIGLR